MSVRVYTGPHADRRGGGPAPLVRAAPVVLALLTMATQLAWALTSGAAREPLTAATVVLLTLACGTHALVVRGIAWALGWFVLSAAIGLGAEIAGLHTGLPFGSYEYTDRLGPAIAGAPVVAAFAWAGMSYPCLLAARRLTAHPVATAAVGAVALASWDLFLDPQLVAEGYWRWLDVPYVLPGIPEIPAQNFVGWLLVALVLMLLLDRLPRRHRDGAIPPDGVPAALLLWTYVSCVAFAALVEHRWAIVAWGGLVMGAVVLPYVVALVRDRP